MRVLLMVPCLPTCYYERNDWRDCGLQPPRATIASTLFRGRLDKLKA